ncbi:MAG TPA: hypothetical protein VJR02_24360 [Pyrinomonadaceae bacterium]|nr:hypothetical protein [Pyrinomonadaceae bacterium]
MKTLKALLSIVALLSLGCSGNNENAHTTATTFVSPPPRQVLKIETIPSVKKPATPDDPKKRADPNKPLMISNWANRIGMPWIRSKPVVIDFSLANAQLKGEGGQFRIRYIVDDEDMRWIDRWEQVVLSGWTEGKHTIRLELIGPDGWPYRNGDYNVETVEFTFTKEFH